MTGMRRYIPHALLTLGLLAGFGRAAAESREVAGHALELSDSLSSVVITTDAGLNGAVRLGYDGDLSCLSVVSGGAAVIGTSGCSDDNGPLRIELPSGMPVTLNASGDGTVHLGDLSGPLVISLSGSVDVKGGRATTLVLTSHSSGDVSMGEIDGSAILNLLGSGDVRLRAVRGYLGLHQHSSAGLEVGSIVASSADLETTGSGETEIGSGSITVLRARLSGSGDLTVAATVQDGEVSASGGSDIRLGRVTGHLDRAASGGSDIVVGGTTRSVHRSSSSGFHHFLTCCFAALMLYIIWRVVRRGGGLGATRRGVGPLPAGAPAHPTVLALGDAMSRLEQRLARVETYVTSREFDLNRKFRELGPQ